MNADERTSVKKRKSIDKFKSPCFPLLTSTKNMIDRLKTYLTFNWNQIPIRNDVILI